MINKLFKAAKYAWKNLVWVPVLAWGVLSLVSHKLPDAQAFDAGLSPMAVWNNINLSTEPVICSSRTYTVDIMDNQFNSLSAQVVYSSSPMRPVSFTDGQASTATIAIASNTALAPATSYVTVAITSNSALMPTTAYITIVISSNSALQKAFLVLGLSSSPFAISYTTSSQYLQANGSSGPYVTMSTPLPSSVQIAVASYTFVEGRDWYRNSTYTYQIDSASQTAISIANALNYSTYGITASTGNANLPTYITTGTNIVVVTAVRTGKYANNFFMQSSTQFAMTVCYSTGPQNAAASTVGSPVGISTATSALNFTGGQDGASLTLITTTTWRLIANRDFFVDPLGSSITAVNITNAINAIISTQIVIASTGNVNIPVNITTGVSNVVLQAVFPGSYANAYTLQSSTQFAMTVCFSTQGGVTGGTPVGIATTSIALNLAGGRNAAYLIFNGVRFTNGIDWFTGSVASATAFSLSNALLINSRTSSTTIVITTATMYTSQTSIIYATTPFINHNEYTMISSSQAALALSTGNVQAIGQAVTSASPYVTLYLDGSSSCTFQGGFNTQIDTTIPAISTGTSAGYSYPVGLAVWLSTVPGQTPPGRLFSGTTYYVTVASNSLLSRSFTLSDTSTGAARGIPWFTGISTQSTQGGNTYTLNPSFWQGANNITFAFSNDGVNFFTVPSASVTVAAGTLANSTTYYDFGTLSGNNGRVNYRYVRETIAASSTTPCSVQTRIMGKY